jgi:hypothetical protein
MREPSSKSHDQTRLIEDNQPYLLLPTQQPIEQTTAHRLKQLP